MRMRGALLLGTGQLLQDARAPAGLTEEQLMEGSTVHVLRSSRPHTLVSCSAYHTYAQYYETSRQYCTCVYVAQYCVELGSPISPAPCEKRN